MSDPLKKKLKAEAKAAKKRAKIENVSVADTSAAKRSADAAERNARLRMLQLLVAVIVGVAVIMGVVYQILE